MTRSFSLGVRPALMEPRRPVHATGTAVLLSRAPRRGTLAVHAEQDIGPSNEEGVACPRRRRSTVYSRARACMRH